MDMNMVVLAGRLATDANIRTFETGATVAELLVVVKQEEPRPRVDVIPVTMWNPDTDEVGTWRKGERVWVAGTIQRKFWSDNNENRTSRIQIVALEVSINKEEVKIDG